MLTTNENKLATLHDLGVVKNKLQKQIDEISGGGGGDGEVVTSGNLVKETYYSVPNSGLCLTGGVLHLYIKAEDNFRDYAPYGTTCIKNFMQQIGATTLNEAYTILLDNPIRFHFLSGDDDHVVIVRVNTSYGYISSSSNFGKLCTRTGCTIYVEHEGGGNGEITFYGYRMADRREDPDTSYYPYRGYIKDNDLYLMLSF